MHPKGVSPLSCGENTNSYKELLKMKKILSILLAMVMIISSITVAFVTFAAAADPTDVVEKINAQSAYVGNADNGDGTTHKLPGYSFIRKLTPSTVVTGDGREIINEIMANKYPEYAEKPYHTDSGYDLGAILANVVGVSAVDKKVKKNSDASLTIGRDALKPLKLDAADVKSATKSGNIYTLKYNDIDIVAGERVEDSVLADITANFPQATGLDKTIVNSLKSHDTALTPSNFTLTIKDLKVTAKFDSTGRFTELSYNYTIAGKVSLTYVDPTPFDVAFTLKDYTRYTSFDYYNEGADFDYDELAKKINAGTAYMVDTKAGYTYARDNKYEKQENSNGDYVDYLFTLNTAELLSSNAALSTVFGTILGYVDKIEISVDEKLGTDLRASKWVCKNANSSDPNVKKCTSSDPHQIWQCTCKDVSGCCSCCPAGTGCTSTHPCDKGGACKSADCKCGYVNDPDCKYVFNTDKELSELDANVAKIFSTIGSALNGTIGETAKTKFAIGSTTANIAPASDPTKKLDKKFAVKATQLDVFDIEEPSFDPSEGSITFKIADQSEENGYKSLSHLTDDYVTNEDFVNALNASFANSLSSLTEKLNIAVLNSKLVYSNITCTVKFVDATEDNMYGTGEIESINLSYDMLAASKDPKKNADDPSTETSTPVIEYTFVTSMRSSVKEVEYVDYEKGDVNMDTKVSIADAQLVLRCIAEMETLNDNQKVLADMNEDSAVSIVDAKKILEKIASQV